MKRAHIPMKEKLAAALYELARLRGQTVYREWREARISADEVIAKFNPDHTIYYAHAGADKWWNLTPMLRADHAEKTKRDLATIAKGKRIQRKQIEHQARMEAKYAGTDSSGKHGRGTEGSGKSRPRSSRRIPTRRRDIARRGHQI